MVATTLTKEMIEAGANLVKKLDEKGVQPDAAFWFYFPDIQQWKLVLAEVKLGSEGPRGIYRRIQDVLSQSKEELKELSLVSRQPCIVVISMVSFLHNQHRRIRRYEEIHCGTC